MRAIVVREFQRDLSGTHLDQFPAPRPGPGEVLVEVHAACLNPVDLGVMAGTFPFARRSPFVPGCDYSGIIAELGPGTEGLKVGQHVFGTMGCMRGLGTFAEYTALPWTAVHAAPPNLSHHQAAASAMVFFTALYGLQRRATLHKGMRVLVNGASGGVGAAAVQVARSAGALVAATGNPAKIAFMQNLGASIALAYSDDDRATALREFAPGGYDLVLEMSYDANGAMDVDLLRVGGKIVMIGCNKYSVNPVNPLQALLKNASVEFTEIFHATDREMASMAAQIRTGFAAGDFRQDVDRAFPLERFPEALTAFRERGAGKIVLDVRSP